MKKAITVKNNNHEMQVNKISRPLKIYYNTHGDPYFNYKKTRYYLNDFMRFDSPYTYKKNNEIQSIIGYYGLTYFYSMLAQIIDGYDPKIVLYEWINDDTIA